MLTRRNKIIFKHSKPNIQSFFKKIKIHDLTPVKIFSDYLKTKNLKNPIVIGPGKGADTLIREMANYLNCDFEILEKERNHYTQHITMKPPKANLYNRDVIIYDDVAASGKTIISAFELVKQKNPRKIFVCLAHLITKSGIEKLQNLGSELITTDTFFSKEPKKFIELSIVPLISEYIKNM
ncbi:MAG: ribose-phosphate diphosphokinase [Candidatus Aenigmatarchaeota archaeon]